MSINFQHNIFKRTREIVSVFGIGNAAFDELQCVTKNVFETDKWEASCRRHIQMLSAEMRFNESSSKFALTNPIGYDSLGSGNGLVYVQCQIITSTNHDDVAKWKKNPLYWPFVRGIHRSLMNSSHKGQ